VAKDLVISATRLHPNLILAGGLTPGNLEKRLAWVQPWAVDVASGVESSPGVKQMDAVLSMVQMIRKTAR
jgi:phosphoribosylanthranilate isomerase